MPFCNKNYLTKIATVQKITLEYKEKGCTQEWIYRKLIFPNYLISRTTFYKYLRTPVARKELATSTL
jgi:hypothetical protein